MMLRKLITEVLTMEEEQVNHMTKSVRIGASQVPPPSLQFWLTKWQGRAVSGQRRASSCDVLDEPTSKPIETRHFPFQTAHLQPLERRPLPPLLPPFGSASSHLPRNSLASSQVYCVGDDDTCSYLVKKVVTIGYTCEFWQYFLSRFQAEWLGSGES